MNKTVKEELENWDNILDDYEKTLGLCSYTEDVLPESELQSYLTMNRDVIEKHTPQQCAEISFRLAQFSFHIQRTCNRETARYNWADETIKEVIGDEINNYKGYGYVEKAYQAIKHNERASKLSKIRKYAKQRMDRLSYLSNSIKNLSDILMSVSRIKVTNNG
jgi:hypothetical protein